MNQVLEKTPLLKSPLDDKHPRLRAQMRESEGWSVPVSYGDEPSEYPAVREGGVGLIDLSPRGRILVSGSEAAQFLNGLITNDMKTLAANSWMPATFPNVQGRLIASARVARIAEATTGNPSSPTYLIDTEAVTHVQVVKTIERFTLAGDFHVSDISRDTVQLTLQGKKSAVVLRLILSDDAAGLASNGVSKALWDGNEMTVIRGTHTGEDGFDLVVDIEAGRKLWDTLYQAGAQPVGYAALETLRIEAGIPRFGIDMDESNVVTETNLDEAISYTKGCYVGQEIIARIKYRGHVAKKLTGVSFEQTTAVEAGARIQSQDGKEIGRITSSTYSPRLGHAIALGYVKYDYLAPGTPIKVVSGEEVWFGQTAQLPFVRVSTSQNGAAD